MLRTDDQMNEQDEEPIGDTEEPNANQNSVAAEEFSNMQR